MNQRRLRVLGTRGVPASHGGFETFVEHLALYLVDRRWRVFVYCQEEGAGPIFEDQWRRIDRVRIPVSNAGPKGTVIFDWKATCHAAARRDLCLTLGYNTAVFSALLRLEGIPNVINMDGIEWARAKWGAAAKVWFWLNDWAGCWLGNHLVADHPEIMAHLESRVASNKITMIPYGADAIDTASVEPVHALGLEPRRFLTVIARAEPENSILEIVKGFSAKPRGYRLVVLGNFQDDNAYHRAIKFAASAEVLFLGAIYNKPVVQALRFHSAAYVHGHQVGGTNPSLVEALGAGNAILAHDNPYNRWVAGESAWYFKNEGDCAIQLGRMLTSPELMHDMRIASRSRFEARFTWERILSEYEVLLDRLLTQ